MPLTRSRWPQTLLLTALALLIAAATIMLACGQGAPPAPAPADGIDALPVAPPVEPTATATPPPPPDTGAGMQNPGGRGPANMPPPPPDPTLKYPNLEHTLDALAIQAEDAAGQSEVAADNFVRVSIWMDTNPEDAATKALVEWLKSRGISSSVYGRIEGYGDGSSISAGVPARLLGAISQQEGVGRVKDARDNVPIPYQPPR